MLQKKGRNGAKRPFGPDREAVGPALLRDLRRVALGNRPGARRIHDHRALAGHQPFVVRGVVPGRHIRRQEGDQLLVEFERLPHLVGLDRRRCPWHRRAARQTPGRRRLRYRRSRWSRRDRCRRERRPCGRPRPPSGMCPCVQSSALGGLPAGYIAWTSMSAYFFIRSMREQGPLIWLPTQAGTPSHLPSDLAEILAPCRSPRRSA